jgi:hypothetical protein
MQNPLLNLSAIQPHITHQASGSDQTAAKKHCGPREVFDCCSPLLLLLLVGQVEVPHNPVRQ